MSYIGVEIRARTAAAGRAQRVTLHAIIHQHESSDMVRKVLTTLLHDPQFAGFVLKLVQFPAQQAKSFPLHYIKRCLSSRES